MLPYLTPPPTEWYTETKWRKHNVTKESWE